MKIVCFHLNQLGDLVFSLPALKSLRDSFPDANITSVVRPGLREVIESSGLVDNIILRPSGFNLKKLETIKEIRSGKYEIAIVFSQSAGSAFLSFISGAKQRFGFVNTSLEFLLTHRISFIHPPSIKNNLRLISEIGCKTTKEDYVGLLKPSNAQLKNAEVIIEKHLSDTERPLVIFSPGTSGKRSVKEWTDEGFAAVGKYLIDNGYSVAIVGSEPANGIVNKCPGIIDLSGKTSLGELEGLLYLADAVVAVDSGVLHLAAALGTKVVGLYGPSNYNITGPCGDGHIIITSNEDCSPCVKTKCPYDRKCMKNINVQAVINAVNEILDNKAFRS